MNPTPNCPKGLFEFGLRFAEVDLVFHCEYEPAQKGSTGGFGEPLEPSFDERAYIFAAYVKGTDVDVHQLIGAINFEHLQEFALKVFKGEVP